MGTVNVYYTSYFQKAFLKLPQKIQERAYSREELFKEYSFHPSLRTHKLKGELEGYWSFSIDYRYRIMFEFLSSDTVLFIDIGTHSIYH